MLTVTIADSEWLTFKSKLGKVFIELYNLRNCRQIYEMQRMIELKKMHVLIVKNPCNLGAH